SADPPWPPGTRIEAARRGVLVHKLLERLPDVSGADRRDAGMHWLERNATGMEDADKSQLLDSALAVLDDPQFADLFGPGSLAEIPIAATVGARVVAGTIDRLLVTPERIRIVDYKTARRPPAQIEDVPVSILRQMAAYAAALEQAYPGRAIDAAVLYTATPQLIAIPDALLIQHKQALATTE
ncbi:MAG: PD-(D/E)XK nuclease family protein, partial [Novosphingobium sp.]|nr:PD-(D/E)XK nuclease family protein [Novosphingobium sp.]